MAERFTSGPWKYDAVMNAVYAGDEGVVVVYDGQIQFPSDGPLIAAAPDLYEVLNKYWDDNGGFFKGVSDEDAALIRAALSKAHPTQGDE